MTRRGRIVAAALGLVLLVAVALGILWFGWDWKALIGWRPLVDCINPKNATGRKDAVQVYALIVAGVVAAITAAVGLLNLGLTRRNLEQQRDLEEQRANQQRQLEEQRAQEDALQAYFEQMGDLLSDLYLSTTDQEDSSLSRRAQTRAILARAQTLTVLARLSGLRKRLLIRFLYETGLIDQDQPIVPLAGADLTNADLTDALLKGADLSAAHLRRADLSSASLSNAHLRGADLTNADLRDAHLIYADLTDALLKGAKVTAEQLATCKSLKGATMPDGSKHA